MSVNGTTRFNELDNFAAFVELVIRRSFKRVSSDSSAWPRKEEMEMEGNEKRVSSASLRVHRRNRRPMGIFGDSMEHLGLNGPLEWFPPSTLLLLSYQSSPTSR